MATKTADKMTEGERQAVAAKLRKEIAARRVGLDRLDSENAAAILELEQQAAALERFGQEQRRRQHALRVEALRYGPHREELADLRQRRASLAAVAQQWFERTHDARAALDVAPEMLTGRGKAERQRAERELPSIEKQLAAAEADVAKVDAQIKTLEDKAIAEWSNR